MMPLILISYIRLSCELEFCTGTVNRNVHCYSTSSHIQSAYIILTYNLLRSAEYDKFTRPTLYKIKP